VNKTLRVLIVDDDPMMARTLADILRVKGHKAEIAHSSAEALVLLDAGPFDCVLSDIRMPGANGVQLHREIVDRYASIPTVLMTAYSSDSLVQEGLDEGVLAVLTKPLDIGAVLAFLCSLRKEYSLVIVDDDPLFCRTLGDLLEARGFAVAAISDPYAVMDCLDENAGIVLLDVKLDGIDGVDAPRRPGDRLWRAGGWGHSGRARARSARLPVQTPPDRPTARSAVRDPAPRARKGLSVASSARM